MAADHGKVFFPPISRFDPSVDREQHAAAADLDGTLLVSRSSFPYFFLVALEAGSVIRAATLLLLSPLVLLVYKCFSEAAGIQMLIFVAMFGLRLRDVELAARAVLPRFYAGDVRAESWEAFRACGRRRVLVTANPTVIVETFAREQLGVDKVLGTELEVDERTGRLTGRVAAGGGVLVGQRKREAVEREFAGGPPPELGLGDRVSDHDFLALCKEAYMVPSNPAAIRVRPEQMKSPVVFHDGRLVQRPDPLAALLFLLWLPLGFFLALLRAFFSLLVPVSYVRHTYRLTGINLVIRGTPPLPPSPGSAGSLFVCNHRTTLDPIFISAALGRAVSCAPNIVNKVSAWSAIDAARIASLVKVRDLIICPEGTTCREQLLLRFSPLFSELNSRIVPVALNTRQSMFYATSARGLKFMDAYFFYMNPRPTYEVTFLEPLQADEACGGGSRTPVEVANRVQDMIAEALGFKCTTLTAKDKYMKLAGYDGNVQPLSSKME